MNVPAAKDNVLTGPDFNKVRGYRSLRSKKRQDYFWAYVMILPNLIGLLAFYIIPIFQTLFFSLNRYRGFDPMKWVGLKNYQKLFADMGFWMSLKNTLVFTVAYVPLSIVISLIVAALLNNKLSGIGIYRTIFFLPQVTLPAAVAMIWQWLFNAEFGLINNLLGLFGIAGPQWITDSRIAIYSIVLVSVWGAIGYNMIILLSGLQDIPRHYYEAASIDGASATQKFFRITIPLLSPTMFFLMITTIIGSLQVFDVIYLMISKSNPAIDSVQSVVFLFFRSSFIQYDKGYGAAIAVVILVIIMIITSIQLALQKKWVHYN